MAKGKARIAVAVDIRDTYRDMKALETGLDDALTQSLLAAGELIVRAAIPLTPYKADDDHPHLRDSFVATARGLVATVSSNLPQGPVWEWGGDIAPGARLGAHKGVKGGVKGLLAKRANAANSRPGATFHAYDPERFVIHIPRTRMVGHAFDESETQIEADLGAAVDRLKARFNLG